MLDAGTGGGTSPIHHFDAAKTAPFRVLRRRNVSLWTFGQELSKTNASASSLCRTTDCPVVPVSSSWRQNTVISLLNLHAGAQLHRCIHSPLCSVPQNWKDGPETLLRPSRQAPVMQRTLPVSSTPDKNARPSSTPPVEPRAAPRNLKLSTLDQRSSYHELVHPWMTDHDRLTWTCSDLESTCPCDE